MSQDPFIAHQLNVKKDRKAYVKKIQGKDKKKMEIDVKRKVDRKVLKNKGGVERYRSKDTRNARVRHRKRFEKKMKQYKGSQLGVKRDLNPMMYAGETAGHNEKIIRSTSLRDYTDNLRFKQSHSR